MTTKAILKVVFNKKAVLDAAALWETTSKSLPKKMSQKTRDNIVYDSLDGNFREGVTEGFVKAEVGAKPKPRYVSNHGPKRQVAMAKLAWIFEKITFESFINASIKERKKSLAISSLIANMAKHPGQIFENDFSSFEYGISKTHKMFEVQVLKHIMSILGVDMELDPEFVGRVVDERTKATKWCFRYKDESGAPCRFTFELDRPIRDSGDRITSSGNWWQNVRAWTEFLVHPDDIVSFIRKLKDNHGGPTQYMSARDRSIYSFVGGFEGDDTAIKLNEAIKIECSECDNYKKGVAENCAKCFFRRRGFAPKLRATRLVGPDFVRFVGYDVLHRDGKPVYQGPDLVMVPEIKRCLTTKSWTLTAVTGSDRAYCEFINAVTMANANECFEPMHAFWSSVAELYEDEIVDNLAGSELSADACCALQESHLREVGTLGTGKDISAWLKTIAIRSSRCCEGEDWQDLARVSAGEFSPEEWGTMSGMTRLHSHGADLALLMPHSWLT